MVEVQQIIAGRQVIDNYRRTHAQLLHRVKDGKVLPVDHSEIADKLFSAFKGLGFNSTREFFEANTQAVKEDMERCVRLEGECDNCEGREEVRGCDAACYENNTTGKGRTRVIANMETGGIAVVNLYQDYFKTLPPRKKGRITQMIPNCSIMMHLIEDPSLEYDWR